MFGTIGPQLDKDVVIEGNEIYDCEWGAYIGNEFDTYAGDVDIHVSLNNNNVHDNTSGGVAITDEDKADGSSVTVSGGGNTIANNGDAGYYIYTSGDGDVSINLSDETIVGHTEGVAVSDSGAPSASSYSVSVTQSNIYANTDFGFNNTVTGIVANAVCNWWGAVDGPSGSGPGSGDAVSDYADFQPWLTQAAPSACDSEGPVARDVAPTTVPLNTPVDLAAVIDDSTTGSSFIASAEYNLDGDAWAAMSADDGFFFDEVAEGVEASLGAFAEVGIHTLCVRGTDAAGNIGPEECVLLAVYDPSGGFVTGGGWIDSPPGAYTPEPSLSGKASFGFVSRYKKGAQTPSGNTEFVFKAAGLNFHSTSYDWLVVNQGGANAQFKGSGTINGQTAPTGDDYRFMLWAGDDEPDTFRIKIWWEADDIETVVYDNGADHPIAGGNIVIHTKKGK